MSSKNKGSILYALATIALAATAASHVCADSDCRSASSSSLRTTSYISSSNDLSPLTYYYYPVPLRAINHFRASPTHEEAGLIEYHVPSATRAVSPYAASRGQQTVVSGYYQQRPQGAYPGHNYHYYHDHDHAYQYYYNQRQSSFEATPWSPTPPPHTVVQQFQSPSLDEAAFRTALLNEGYALKPAVQPAFRSAARGQGGSLNVKLPLPFGLTPLNNPPLPLQKGAPIASLPKDVTSYGTRYPQRRRR